MYAKRNRRNKDKKCRGDGSEATPQPRSSRLRETEVEGPLAQEMAEG